MNLKKNKEVHRLRERTYDCLCIHLYLKWIPIKDVLHNTWNSAQHHVAVGCGWIHLYIWLSPFAVLPKLSQLC